MRPAFPPRAVLNLLLAAFTLRGFALERHSLGVDEAATWAGAVRPTLGETVFADASRPPVWRVLTRIWITLFGDSETSLRAPAALCGVATVLLAWRLGRRLFSPAQAPRRGGFVHGEDDGAGAQRAIWFLAWAALATPFVEVGQEAAPYALLLLESVALALLYLRWLDRGDLGIALTYGALGALALFTHPAALGPLAAFAVHALFLAARTRRDPDGSQRVSPWPIPLAALAAWLLYHVIWGPVAFAGSQRLALVKWTTPEGSALDALDPLRRMAAGPAIVMESPWTWVTDVIWLPVLLLGLWGLRKSPGTRSLVLCALGAMTLATVVPLGRYGDLRPQVLAPLALWLWLLATVGAFALPVVLRWLLLAALAALVGLGIVGYHVGTNALVPAGSGADLDGRTLAAELVPDPQDPTWFLHHGRPYAKDPWRDVQEFVKRYGRDDDLVVLSPDHARDVWDYYDRTRPGGPLSVLPLRMPLAAYQASLFASHDRVFVITPLWPPRGLTQLHLYLTAPVEQAWRTAGSSGSTQVPPIPFRHGDGLALSVISRPR